MRSESSVAQRNPGSDLPSLRIIRVDYQVIQKGHEFIGALEPVDFGTRGSQLFQCSFLAGQIRLDIDMGNVDARGETTIRSR
jgi:hypothetical protein